MMTKFPVLSFSGKDDRKQCSSQESVGILRSSMIQWCYRMDCDMDQIVAKNRLIRSVKCGTFMWCQNRSVSISAKI